MAHSTIARLNRLLSEHPDRSHETDGELMARFVRSRDPDAFAAIVARHRRFVHSACRQVLTDPADIDDVCQATFLVLLNRANSVVWHDSLGSWLYAVAHRLSVNARRRRHIRTARESHAAAGRNEPAPPADVSWTEAVGILHDELNRLPDRYRLPLLLCSLEGATRDEAAAQLHCTPGAIKGRLERGRDLLAKRLRRRGIALSAALFGSMMARGPVAADDSFLPEKYAKMPSPAVRQLAASYDRPGIAKFAIGFALLLCAGVLLSPSANGGRPTATAPVDHKSPSPKPDGRTISGTVTDPQGKPVANAELLHIQPDGQSRSAGRTMGDGTYRIVVPANGAASYLTVRHAGYGSQVAELTPKQMGDVNLRLVEDEPVRGRLIDPEGRPVAGARVVLRSLSGYPKESLADLLKSFEEQRREQRMFPGLWRMQFDLPPDWHRESFALPYAATTDADGRFALAGAGRERLATLSVRGTGIADQQIHVVTRAGLDVAPYNRRTEERRRQTGIETGYFPRIFATGDTVIVEKAKPIRGVAVDAGTGKPITGLAVRVRVETPERVRDISTTTDERGEFRLTGVRKWKRYDISVARDDRRGFLGRTVSVEDTAGYEPVDVRIGIASGIILTGRITDAQTGLPLHGFVSVGTLHDNEFVRNRPEMGSPDCYLTFAETDRDGRYRTVVPPGPIVVMGGVRGVEGDWEPYKRYEKLLNDPDFPEYFPAGDRNGFYSDAGTITARQGNSVKVLKLPPDTKEFPLDIPLKPLPPAKGLKPLLDLLRP
jgi:RNA polymerase sigma factor (sigma-70 family)